MNSKCNCAIVTIFDSTHLMFSTIGLDNPADFYQVVCTCRSDSIQQLLTSRTGPMSWLNCSQHSCSLLFSLKTPQSEMGGSWVNVIYASTTSVDKINNLINQFATFTQCFVRNHKIAHSPMKAIVRSNLWTNTSNLWVS